MHLPPISHCKGGSAARHPRGAPINLRSATWQTRTVDRRGCRGLGTLAALSRSAMTGRGELLDRVVARALILMEDMYPVTYHSVVRAPTARSALHQPSRH